MISGIVKDSLSASNAFWASSSHTNLFAFFNSLKKGKPFSPSLLMKRPHHSCELHDVFLVGWLGHVAYSVDLCRVGFNASMPDHEAQEQSRRYIEDTLGWVELPLELS
jgi:hypothetical protein